MEFTLQILTDQIDKLMYAYCRFIVTKKVSINSPEAHKLIDNIIELETAIEILTNSPNNI